MKEKLTTTDIIHTPVIERLSNGSSLFFKNMYTQYPDPSEYDKVLFLVYDGALRQFKIKNCAVYPFNKGISLGSRDTFDNVTTLEVAGIGEIYVGNYLYGGQFNFDVYETFEDFENGKKYDMKYAAIDNNSCAAYFGTICHSSQYESHVYMRRWYWSGVSAELLDVKGKMPICFIIDKNGTSFPDGWNPNQMEGYQTREACIADNKINVCYFEEERPKTFSIKAEAVFSRTIDVVATSYDEAIEKAKKELSEKSFDENDNNGTQFS